MQYQHCLAMDDRTLAEADRMQELETLRREVKLLKEELTVRRNAAALAAQAPPPVPAPIPEPEPAQELPRRRKREKSRETKFAAQELLSQCQELAAQVQDAEEQRDVYFQQLRSLESQMVEMDRELQRFKVEQENAQIVHKETVAELESMRKVLHQRDPHKDEKAWLRREIQSQKSAITNLQQTITAYETQLHEVAVAKGEIASAADKHLASIRQLEQTVAADNKTIAQLRSDLTSAEARLKAHPKLTLDDFLPISAWRPTEFDDELNSQITNIGANQSLEPSTKLHAIYREINSYFVAALESRNATVTQLHNQKNTLCAGLHDFLMNLQIALSFEPIPLLDFIAQKRGDRLVASVNQIVTQNDDLHREKEQLMAALSCLNEQLRLPLDSDLSAAVQQISSLMNSIDVHATALEQQKRKYHDLRDHVRILEKKFGNEAVHFDSHTASLHDNIDSLTGKITDLTSTNQTLKKELSISTANYRELQLQFDQSCAALITDHESALHNIQSVHESVESQLREEVARLQQRSAALSDTLSRRAAKIKVLKKTVYSQKITIGHRNTEIESLRGEIARLEDQSVETSESDKSQPTEPYTNVHADLQRQCEAQRHDLERLAHGLTSTRKRLQISKAENLQLRREAARRDREWSAVQQQTDRERALQETSTRAARLSAESTFAQRIQEQQATADADKRRLLGAIADALPAFLSSGPVDDRSAREALDRARSELTRLSDSDRAIRAAVGAAPHERTADAVTQRLRENL
jgi:chromosome segregation ATPase